MSEIMQKTKTLTRVKLVNWHYFANETIDVAGSFLISGENGSGKSTILDAIQLVLTTNTRRFNPAANEKSKRDLKGYVRCKTGEEGRTYLRGGKAVISYVALEFYESSKNKYFVLGVKLDSPDMDSEIKKKWFCEEATLDSLSFVIDRKPAFDNQFLNNGKKITFIQQTSEAKDRFKRRLGNLEDTFFDMIPKSLAFKPMDNIRDFITKFILPQKAIDVNTLRENIHNLRELQTLIEDIKGQIAELDAITLKNDEIAETETSILVIDILLLRAELEAYKDQLESLNKLLATKQIELKDIITEEEKAKGVLRSETETKRQIDIAISSNECTKLIDKLKSDLRIIEEQKKPLSEKHETLKQQINNVIRAIQGSELLQCGITMPEIRALYDKSIGHDDRVHITESISNHFVNTSHRLIDENVRGKIRSDAITETLVALEKEIVDLKKDKLTYPPNVEMLRKAIEDEFAARKISGYVRIFADLLEICDPMWQDAIEGYLNTQRFALIVEPDNYDIAAEVYDRVKDTIHSTLLVNTQKLDLNAKAEKDSLASMVKSTNRYATAYAVYLMGRVVMCDNVGELKTHPVSITQGCMLYQSKALRKIADAVYRVPYIGKYARRRQLEIKTEDHRKLGDEKRQIDATIHTNNAVIGLIDTCSFDLIRSYIDVPCELEQKRHEYEAKNIELKEAEKDPSIIELQFKLRECEGRVEQAQENLTKIQRCRFNIERDVSDNKRQIDQLTIAVAGTEGEYCTLCNGHETASADAERKFAEHQRTKSADTIKENYGRRRSVLVNQKSNKINELSVMQAKFRDGELGTGLELMTVYFEEADRLKRHELIQYEEKLESAKSFCETEFRESFLAKMRENIESAKQIFKDLNRSLQSIYYGNDSYKFLLTPKREKQSLYNMITSEVNVAGLTLFSQQFDAEYHAEMDDLFSKLTESDTTGEGILREYTDYREYLDYDIEIVSKDGKSQYFSKTYGEKSGGETQTPYYVAIAASFSQIYRYGDTIRIIMLDEAFDKMDDERIVSMMEFFRSQNYQIILATPPAKLEVIGEYVDTVLMAYRNGDSSIVERYDL